MLEENTKSAMIVWLPSYPRSGNTLLRTMLRQVFGLGTNSKYNDSSDLGADPAISSAVGHLSYAGCWEDELSRIRNGSDLRLVKTHEAPEGDEPAIFIVRHGWLACVSNQHYLRDFRGTEAPLADVIAGTIDEFPSWGRMLDLWDPLNRPHTLLIRFEDLVNSPQDVITSLHSFLKVPMIAEWKNNFAELQRLNSKFFRAGKVDMTEESFGHENAALFASLHGDWMHRLGYAKNGGARPALCGRLRSLIECNSAIGALATTAKQQAEYIAVLEKERSRLTTESETARADATSARSESQRHIDAIKAQLDQLAATSHEQAALIAILQRERDRMASESESARADATSARSENQRHIDSLKAQLDRLATASQQQTDHIAVLEAERDRLGSREQQLMQETEHLASTTQRQADHIAVLEAERDRLESREKQLMQETAHYLRVMDEQHRYIKTLESERNRLEAQLGLHK